MKNDVAHEPAFLRDSFIENYLFADTLFSRFCSRSDLRTLYGQYARTFRIKDRVWLDNMWNIISSDLFALADNTDDYNRLVRLSKYYSGKLSADEQYVLSHKAAPVAVKANMFPNGDDIASGMLLPAINRKAAGGGADCLAMLGFLEFNGFFAECNKARALERIHDAASWNNLFAILCGLDWDSRRDFYERKLCAYTQLPSGDTLRDYLMPEMNIPAETAADRVALALEDAFGKGSLLPGQINRDAVAVMYSKIMSEDSKTALLKSLKKPEDIPQDIPLGVTSDISLTVDFEVFRHAAPERKSEISRIKTNLSMCQIRWNRVYKPLLICGEDGAVLDYYRSAMKKIFAGSPLSHAVLNENTQGSFSHGRKNIFTDALEEQGNSELVLLIDGCEKLGPDEAEEFAAFIDPNNLGHFRTGPEAGVELCLAGVLPLMFSQGMPEACLAACCDVIEAKSLSRSEFGAVLDETIEDKRETFRLTSLTADKGIRDFLFDYSFDTVSGILNKAIACRLTNGSDIHLTLAELQSIVSDYASCQNSSTFWGDCTK